MNTKKPTKAPFDTLLGIGPKGLKVYSSNYDSIKKSIKSDRDSFRSYFDNIWMGFKWQCVELARRWMYLNTGYTFEDVPMAYDIFKLKDIKNPHTKTSDTLPLHSFKNGSQRHPEPGCLLIWDEGGQFEVTGHVAIVTEVLDDKIRIIEQNVDDTIWVENQNYSRELKAVIDQDGGYWIKCECEKAKILGWVIQTQDASYSEKPSSINPTLLNIILRRIPENNQSSHSWLNVANEDENVYVKVMNGHKLTSSDEDQYKFLCISKSAEQELKRVSNELHMMFLRTTDHIMSNPDLLSHFSIPPIIWPKLQKSWSSQYNQMITGRLDFTMSNQGLKVYEYNADSASCYMECGKVQLKWADHFGCDIGNGTGERLQPDLVAAWKRVDGSHIVHLLYDDNPEETYHTLFMKECIELAGFTCKAICGVDAFSFDKNGNIVDADGTKVKIIWKTWAWETVLEQLRNANIEDCENLDNFLEQRRTPLHSPKLFDILLHEKIQIFEPFWTIIPSNKAVLPILTELYPDHPNLLKSSFDFNEDLFKDSYVIKPISGRCGENIKIVKKDGDILFNTDGQFDKKNYIFQEYFSLPKVDDKNIQISTFIVFHHYAGSCARTDPSLILTSASDILALRIIDDWEILADHKLP
ncbi:MAG: bifunctional glutathionylspermidine amidase/synthase [Bdellovibrionales bacterium RIFOXYA1_FULL_36_14]|nr:MAG: bifunctional glutathionylspermidine amidase/synthase [Bdellovibrionales bacterium RIFOXYA1_FULL_36_14]